MSHLGLRRRSFGAPVSRFRQSPTARSGAVLRWSILRALLSVLLMVLAAAPARAVFHGYGITEIFSSADGSVQFVRLDTFSSGQNLFAGITLTCTRGAITHTFTFPTNLPSSATANRSVLIATSNFASLQGGVTPNYIIPAGFIFTAGGNLNFANVSNVDYAALPTDGQHSINAAGVQMVNAPRNFAGATGSVNVSAGACCKFGLCSVTVQTGCASDWTSGGVCSPNPCPEPTGACCSPTSAPGSCAALVSSVCAAQSGSYQGHNSTCSANPCSQPTGACCSSASSACTVGTQASCVAAGGVDGTYQSNGSACSPNPCPTPTGACCLPSGYCSVLSFAACAGQSGTFGGNASVCSSFNCRIVLSPFVDPLPVPAIATPTTGTAGGAAHYDIHMVEVSRKLHRDLPSTIVWGYEGQYPGPTIEARRDQPITVSWINDLRDITTGQLRTTHSLAVDTCLRGPDITGSVPRTVVHLHGLRVAPDSDGDPVANFPPGSQSTLYHYPNIQQAATLWYHDHALGLTRLNVYMGLAGMYFIRDAAEDALGLPSGEYEIPLVIQDRSFNPDGSLKYLDSWQDHFAGDFILVNGKVWPYLSVKQGKYRFRMVNGSGTRVYALALSNGAAFQQIGSDQGLLAAPVSLTQLQIAPGERADIVIDFAAYAPGTEIVLTNSAPVPVPNGPTSTVVPNVMKFIVGAQSAPSGPLPAALASGGVPRIPESEAVLERTLELMQVSDTSCPAHGSMWLINGLMWDDITEFPRVGTTEIWSWINGSADIHSMHIHLVQLQVLDRQDFTVIGNTINPIGPRIPPTAGEAGWKDTVQAHPGQITRVIQRFTDFSGLFPYHCHILEHEDHEMMRQFNLLCTAPSVVTQPSEMRTCQGATVIVSCAAAGDVLRYQWRRNGVAIADGAMPGGTVYTGAASPSLLIANGAAPDSGSYDCLITNPCGQATTLAASVRFCAGDTSCSGTITVQDIFEYLGRFFALDPRADTNRSGQITIQDIFDFLTSWFAGC